MSWQLAYYTQELATNKERLKDLTDFVNLEEREGAIDKPDESGIKLKSLEFKNVSFKYPGTDNYILKNISFNIEEGRHYAFVGVNGSGKQLLLNLSLDYMKNLKEKF